MSYAAFLYNRRAMTPLTAFGLFAVTAMLVFYALEKRSPWFTFAFAVSCALASVYGFLQGAWPFGGGSCLVSGGAAPLVAGASWK
jgi:hypothetical protein